jgi:hypothetical protein
MKLQSEPTGDSGSRWTSDARGTAGRIPRQRSRRTGPRVTTFFDGARWSYRVESEPALGHGYADLAQAVAGGRYLARTMRAEHVIENEDGTVLERTDFGEQCSCHPRRRARQVV